jgi:outer membrane protein TolC
MNLWLALVVGLAAAPLTHPLDADECVRIALGESGQLDEAEAKVRKYEARLAEVEAVYRPKIDATAYVAPMFKVHGGALDRDVDRDYSPGSWGPYAHLQAVLAQPFYSFGRVEAGEDAARGRADVERARLRETRNTVALEVRRLYYTHLFARSVLPALDSAAEIVAEAEGRATELHESGSGDVTQVDLMKLSYGRAEVTRYQRIARDGADLALSALKHTMGLPDEAPLVLADQRLPPLGEAPEPALPELLREASELRPEWAQLVHGEKAALSLRDAERLANAPVAFLGASLAADWAPTRDDADNPYHYDPYNQLTGGVAVGLKWDFDPWKAAARTDAAEALGDRIAALRRFAATGIPLQVRKAHQAVAQHRDLVAISQQAVAATRKWMAFAAAAYKTGTGDASDLLEGLVAYLQSRRTEYEQLHAYHESRAELSFAIGRDGVLDAAAP